MALTSQVQVQVRMTGSGRNLQKVDRELRVDFSGEPETEAGLDAIAGDHCIQ